MDKKNRIATIFSRLQAENPEPKTELAYTTPYQLLIAVVMSAQTTDVAVNKATAPLFRHILGPADMLHFGEAALQNAIQTIGLFRAKAKNVLALSRILLEKHGGNVPRSRPELEALPGVGSKTAAVVLNALWGEPTIAVDTHVFRVAKRLKIATGATPDAVEAQLTKAIPLPYRRHAHHWLILHGRYTCKAVKPLCHKCILADVCPSNHTPKPA